MNFKFKVIKRNLGQTDEIFSIHEVCYDEEGQIERWQEDPVMAIGRTTYEIKQILKKC